MLRFIHIRGLLLCCLLLLITACTAIPPLSKAQPEAVPRQFSHEKFDRVLRRYVDAQGRVDYTALQKQAGDLEAYYALIAQYSPDSYPQLFANEDDRLAYWINAYNAAAIKIVLNYYPISGIEDVDKPGALFFVPGKWRFFVFNRPRFGEISTSLYYLENSVVRKRFNEPRIHFALNCASVSCPYLPRSAFTGLMLDQQLERETRIFFSQTRNFHIDHANKTIFLSSILDWYQDDFIDWLINRYPRQQDVSLLDYIALYVDADTADKLRGSVADYNIEFIPYDWNLNDSTKTR